MNKKESFFTTKTITLNGIIAALYAVITVACAQFSYSFAQFRISELLNLLVFFNPYYTVGLTLGCLLANLFSTVGPIDIVFGTLTTLVACLLMIVYSKFVKNLFSVGFIPCILNAIVVPFTIYVSTLSTEDPMVLDAGLYFMMFGWVFLGEFVCIVCVGYPLFLYITKHYSRFNQAIQATRNLDYKW